MNRETNFANDRIANEYQDSGKYKQLEKTCSECNEKFTLNVPLSWFDGNGKIKERNLPSGISLLVAQESLHDTVCGNCHNKEQIAKAAEQMNQQWRR